MKKNSLGQFLVAVLILTTTILVQASQPKFSLLPIVRAPTLLPINSIGTAQYLIINNTELTRTLTMVPIPGISQNGGSCSNPFTLAPRESCLLSLQLMPLQMAACGVHIGPLVCKTVGPHDTRPDAFLCSQANPDDMFNVTIVR